MKPKFWKLSQGTNQFNYHEILDSIEQRLVYVHKNTGAKGTSYKTQANDFISAEIGDYFYLTYGNNGIYLLGQFSGPANLFSKYGKGWLDRPYRFIKSSINKGSYNGQHKWWSPNDNSTFTRVPDDELALFEKEILIPFFEIRLSDYGM